MAVALLDVNVLVALAWPDHMHHGIARAWFSANRGRGWATCPLTELSFLRLAIQPSVVRTPPTFAQAMESFAITLQAPEHRFWPLDYSVTDLHPEIRARLAGPQQLTDALLLDLAIRHGGKLATFDRRIEMVLPADSPHRDAIELIPC